MTDYPSLYDKTGDIKDLNTLLVPRDRIAELEMLCAETYQVVGVLASDANRFGNSPDVMKVLDNLSAMKRMHTDVLPFASGKQVAALEAENVELRKIVSDSLAALGTSSGCTPEASLAFMRFVPDEIRETVAALREALAEPFVPQIDYTVIHAFSESQSVSYNETCAMVRSAVAAAPKPKEQTT